MGLIVLIVTVFMWVNELQNIPFVSEPIQQRSMFGGETTEIQPAGTITPAGAAERRANINQRYGVITSLVILATTGLGYIFKDHENKTT